MSLKEQHPEFAKKLLDWQMLRDFYEGEHKVKMAGTLYLKPTPGQVIDGMNTGDAGLENYMRFKERARFPGNVEAALENALGIMHSAPPTIELPEKMEAMRENATNNNETLEMLLRKINQEQLLTGRLGIALDIPQISSNNAPLVPYIALYAAECITNWDDGSVGTDQDKLNLVVLNESGYERINAFTWDYVERYRVLNYGDILDNEVDPGFIYTSGLFRDANFNESMMLEPSLFGAKFDEIPFVFINSKDLLTTPDKSPLLGLANLVLQMYRAEADYRFHLFMQGQDTLVRIGANSDEEVRVGAGGMIDLEIGGDAKYIGVNSIGLSEQREALKTDNEKAEAKSMQLMASRGDNESGKALSLRREAQTASLTQIAMTGAAGLEKLLKMAARLMGLNEDDVVVIPNTEFGDIDLIGFGDDLVKLMTARSMGAPISKKSIHTLMIKKGLTDLSLDDELENIDEDNMNAGVDRGNDRADGFGSEN